MLHVVQKHFAHILKQTIKADNLKKALMIKKIWDNQPCL